MSVVRAKGDGQLVSRLKKWGRDPEPRAEPIRRLLGRDGAGEWAFRDLQTPGVYFEVESGRTRNRRVTEGLSVSGSGLGLCPVNKGGRSAQGGGISERKQGDRMCVLPALF